MSRSHPPLRGLLLLLLALAILAPSCAPFVRAAGPTSVACSPQALVQAIRAAEQTPEEDTLSLADGCTYSYSSGAFSRPFPLLNRPLVIVGNGATIERPAGAGGRLRFFEAYAGLTLRDLTLRGGSVPGSSGGAIFSTAAVTLEQVTLEQNRADFGGAVFTSGSLSVVGGAFSDNSATAEGGAVFVRGALSIRGAVFSGNQSEGAGGAIATSTRAAPAEFRLVDSQFERNRSRYGGAVHTFWPLTVSGGRFLSNAAAEMGGALFIHGALTVSGTTFEDNTASGQGGGGAIMAGGAEAAVGLSAVRMSRNQATAGAGGAILVAGPLSVSQSDLRINFAATTGSAIAARRSVELRRNIFAFNRTRDAGATLDLNAQENRTSVLESNLWLKNASTAEGGAVLCLLCAEGGSVSRRARVSHETIIGGEQAGGVGLLTRSGDVAVTNSIVSGFAVAVRRAGAEEGALLVSDSNLYWQNGLDEEQVDESYYAITGQDPQFVDPAGNDYRPREGSPAVGAAVPSDVALDLLGVHRPQDGLPDIGAYEYDLGELPEAAAVALPCPGGAGDVAALGAAIEQANATPGAQRISLAAGCAYTLAERLPNGAGLPTVGDYLEIIGNGATLRRDPGAGPLRILVVDAAPLSLIDLAIEGGAAPRDISGRALGGGILARQGDRHGAVIALRNVRMSGNSAATEGGAIHLDSGVLTVDGGLWQGNRSDGIGGAISVAVGSLWLRDAELRENRAAYGGAVGLPSSSARIEGATFGANSAVEGGAVFANGDGATMIGGSRFRGNSAGGGTAIQIGAGEVINSLLVDNPTDDGTGGVIVARPAAGGAATILHSTIVQPGAQSSTPAISAGAGVTVRNTITANFAAAIAGLDGATPAADHNLAWSSQQAAAGLDAEFRPSPGSAAIDAGAASPVERDLAGNRRPVGRAPDIGAYETTAGNKAPVGVADRYSVAAGGRLSISAPGVLANDRDGDGDPLRIELLGRPGNGQLTLKPNGSFSYRPNPGFSGADSFTYRVGDGLDSSAPVTVTIQVTGGGGGGGGGDEDDEPHRVYLPLLVR